MRQRIGWLLVVPFFAMLTACTSSFREHHFFASKNEVTGEPVNYYRLEVRGTTSISSSRYLSGYFDPDAVASYFGEVTASTQDQTFPVAAPASSKNAVDATKAIKDENLTSIDPQKQNRQLVMLLSSNSEAIADQLGELASSKDLAVSIAAFAASSRIGQAQQASASATAAGNDAKRVMDLGDSVFAYLPTTANTAPTTAQLRSAMLMLTNRLCGELGARQTFSDLPSAQKWLQENRERWEVTP